MLKEPPTSRQMLCLTGEREGARGRIFPHDLWDRDIPGGLRRKEQAFFHFPHIQAEPDDGKERKSKWQEGVEK